MSKKAATVGVALGTMAALVTGCSTPQDVGNVAVEHSAESFYAKLGEDQPTEIVLCMKEEMRVADKHCIDKDGVYRADGEYTPVLQSLVNSSYYDQREKDNPLSEDQVNQAAEQAQKDDHQSPNSSAAAMAAMLAAQRLNNNVPAVGEKIDMNAPHMKRIPPNYRGTRFAQAPDAGLNMSDASISNDLKAHTKPAFVDSPNHAAHKAAKAHGISQSNHKAHKGGFGKSSHNSSHHGKSHGG